MNLNQVIQDIRGLDAELAQLEKRYGLPSSDFYRLYQAGKLEQTRDCIQWVGYYETKLKREERRDSAHASRAPLWSPPKRSCE